MALNIKKLMMVVYHVLRIYPLKHGTEVKDGGLPSGPGFPDLPVPSDG